MLGIRDVLAAVLGSLIVQYLGVRLVSLLLLGGVNPVKVSPSEAPLSLVLILLIVPPLAGLAWIWFVVVWGERDGWQRLGFRPGARPLLFRAVLVGLFAVILVQVVVALTPEELGQPQAPFLTFDQEVHGPVVIYRLAYAVGAAALAPLFEEVLFRGLLFGWMRRHFPFLGSAVIAALPHAALHGDAAAIPALTVTFVLFAWIYEREGTLWAPIFAHGIYNSTVLLLLLV